MRARQAVVDRKRRFVTAFRLVQHVRFEREVAEVDEGRRALGIAFQGGGEVAAGADAVASAHPAYTALRQCERRTIALLDGSREERGGLVELAALESGKSAVER